MDSLIDKAWDLYSQTVRVPVQTILTAITWLEEKHRKAPSGKLAQAIALHYLIIALRSGRPIKPSARVLRRGRALASAGLPSPAGDISAKGNEEN
jgi:hypothetical protein